LFRLWLNFGMNAIHGRHPWGGKKSGGTHHASYFNRCSMGCLSGLPPSPWISAPAAPCDQVDLKNAALCAEHRLS
jgi:hypothetical protein